MRSEVWGVLRPRTTGARVYEMIMRLKLPFIFYTEFPLGHKVANIKRKSLKGKHKLAVGKGKEGGQSYKNKQLLTAKKCARMNKKYKSEKGK